MSRWDPPKSAVEQFDHLITRPRSEFREGAPELPKFKRIRNVTNLQVARGLRCANPNCPHKRAKVFSFFWLDGAPNAAPQTDPHHIQTRGAGGGDDAKNVCPLCRDCHELAGRNEFERSDVLTWCARTWHITKLVLAEMLKEDKDNAG